MFDYDKLTRENDAASAIRRFRPSSNETILLYRGWMLKPKQYTALFEALLAKNYRLVNSPTEYQNCHYLPDSYKFIKGNTPRTEWLYAPDGLVDWQAFDEMVTSFGDVPLIVKDFVKSQKHYWDTACFIPSAKDLTHARGVAEKFMLLQGDDLTEGLVLRAFVDLCELSVHSRSGMPLTQEYRLFFCNGRLLSYHPYWEEGAYTLDEIVPLDKFVRIAKSVESNFFSMDVAKTKEGEWIVIELGDGQVTGLPERADRNRFYQILHNCLHP